MWLFAPSKGVALAAPSFTNRKHLFRKGRGQKDTLDIWFWPEQGVHMHLMHPRKSATEYVAVCCLNGGRLWPPLVSFTGNTYCPGKEGVREIQ